MSIAVRILSPMQYRRCERVASPLASVRSWSGRPFRRCSPKPDETTDPPSSRSHSRHRSCSQRAAAGADDEWSQCGPGFQVPDRPAQEAAESSADPETIHLSADQAEVVEEGVSRFTGNVTIEQGTRQLQSEEIVYSQSENVIEAKGGVRFWDDGLVRHRRQRPGGNRADQRHLRPHGGRSCWKESTATASASEVSSSGIDRLSARDVSYTTCNPGEADWRITAEPGRARSCRGRRHRQERVAGVQGTTGDVPALDQLPVEQPAKVRTPHPRLWRSVVHTGAEVTVPYYFNLAPNYDATIAARTMSRPRRTGAGRIPISLQYLRTTGEVAAHHIPSRLEVRRQNVPQPTSCTGTGGRTGGRRTPDWSGCRTPRITKTWERSLSQSSRTHLTRRFDARYRGDRMGRTLVRLQDFMTLDRTIDRPYARLPQVLDGELSLPERNRALNFDLTAELAYFDRESHTTGSRVDLQPSFTFPHRTAGAFFTPKAVHCTSPSTT